MAKIKVIDTHTLCPVLADRAAIKGVPAGSKILVNGTAFTTKADKNGAVAEHMLYLVEAVAFSKLVGKATRSEPVEIEYSLAD